MSKKINSYNLGFPRIGENRELKFALEAYWGGKISFEELENTAKTLRKRAFELQSGFDVVSANDFSYYDGMLDMMFHLGAFPSRFADIVDPQARYFTMARGDKTHTSLSMLKWFNTNYHYLVPELDEKSAFAPNSDALKKAYDEACELCETLKINIIGPVTFLALSNGGLRLKDSLFEKLLEAYEKLVSDIAGFKDGIIIQIDEPIAVCEPDENVLSMLKTAYERLPIAAKGAKIVVATYFDHAVEAANVLCDTPIWGIALDFVHGKENLQALKALNTSDKTLIAGVIDGKNVWAADLDEKISLLEQISRDFNKDRLVIAPSCSLLHTPYSLKNESSIDPQVLSWLAFANEKTKEITLLSKIFFGKELDNEDKKAIEANKIAVRSRKTSQKTQNQSVISAAKLALETASKRAESFEQRILLQNKALNLPPLPTTTIGSFPQSADVRAVRKAFKDGVISKDEYEAKIKEFIKECVEFQEEIGLDVLVHGEFERNDMVEYFGELLDGVVVSRFGWVQSYGSRCVKPPIIYGSVKRKAPMTVEYAKYAQSLSKRWMKGMLTGPVTLLNWSFERDDIPKEQVCAELAVAVRDEVLDLEAAGIKIIQVDEAAFKEGYPLRSAKKKAYEEMALKCFWISTSAVKADTQIHTHMCYSVFDDIMDTVEAMDADVITIETAKAGNRLLGAFKKVGYGKEVGPGIYDIHSPRIPSVEEMSAQIDGILEVLPASKVWINPDCGLKTRKWEETKASLINMVKAAKIARNKLS